MTPEQRTRTMRNRALALRKRKTAASQNPTVQVSYDLIAFALMYPYILFKFSAILLSVS